MINQRKPTDSHQTHHYHKLQYRNGIYIGEQYQTVSEKYGSLLGRAAFGMFVSDEGEFVIGGWDNECLEGEYVYISQKMRVYGTMKRGVLEGFNVICSMNSLFGEKQKSPQITIYANFRNGEPYGNIILIFQNFIIVYEIYENSRWSEPLQQHILTSQNLSLTLQEYFPYSFRDELPAYLHKIIQKQIGTQTKTANVIQRIYDKLQSQETANRKSEYVPVMRNYEHGKVLYGFMEAYRGIQYGIILRDHQLISLGVHQNSLLSGMGLLFIPPTTAQYSTPKLRSSQVAFPRNSLKHNKKSKYQVKDCILDGVFENGYLNGIGICYNKQTGQFILGNFCNKNQSEILESGIGWPELAIKEYRMQFHLRSMKFVSGFYEIDQIRQNFEEIVNRKILIAGKRANKTSKTHQNTYLFKSQANPSPNTRVSPNIPNKRRFTQHSTSANKKQKQKPKSNYFTAQKSDNLSSQYESANSSNKNKESVRRRNWTHTSNEKRQQSRSKNKKKLFIKTEDAEDKKFKGVFYKSKRNEIEEARQIEELSKNSLYHDKNKKNSYISQKKNNSSIYDLNRQTTTRKIRAQTQTGRTYY